MAGRLWCFLGGVLAVLAAGGAGLAWVFWPRPGDPGLRGFVYWAPPVPVVFTSRSEPASFQAAAPEGTGHVWPGQPPWQAREGRLRLLTTAGAVVELTWGRPLPDGGTLIDVLSPSVSAGGKWVVFAGRRGDDHGRFRLYEVGLDGQGLRSLTGGADDPGCTELPPLRYRSQADQAAGRRMPDEERRRVDYDDVDPVYLPDGQVVFASSRTPDLGRGHARRSTQLWVLDPRGGTRARLTNNRNNDRWPFVMLSNYLLFSLWSRNTEVITADRRDVRPYEPGLACATRPTDAWFGGGVLPDGTRLGVVVKPHLPVWRPRPLFNGRIVFMTAEGGWSAGRTPAQLRVAQVDDGVIHAVPSARAAGQELPTAGDYVVRYGPARDEEGQSLSLATPSPCPPGRVLLAGAPYAAGERAPSPGRYGIYLVSDDWPAGTDAPAPTLLFDDPDLVDAEPVAVYPRPLVNTVSRVWPGLAGRPAALRLHDGRTYPGPVGLLRNANLSAAQNEAMPGQRTDTGAGPIFTGPPADRIAAVRFYASHRDRFDDPKADRVAGAWEYLAEVPLQNGVLETPMPAGPPLVLAGFDREGRVASWTTAARDRKGQQAAFLAFAGDHYSGARARTVRRDFCVGCHTGHSNPGFKEQRERVGTGE
jgi:hypothetical protein